MRISDWSSDVCSSDLRLMPGSNTGSVSFFDAVWWLSGADSPRGSASWLQARVSDCQTAFKAGSDSLFVHLGSVSWSEEAGSEQIELCAAVHLALHELQPGEDRKSTRLNSSH